MVDAEQIRNTETYRRAVSGDTDDLPEIVRRWIDDGMLILTEDGIDSLQRTD